MAKKGGRNGRNQRKNGYTITPPTSRNCAGMVTNGFLVEAKRANLDELRQKYPEAFNRPYDKGSGLTLERVMYKGEGK